MLNLKQIYPLILIIFIILIILFTPAISESTNLQTNSSIASISHISSNENFMWPLPQNSYISSYFGRRSSPTAYASSFHKGIDIPATPGTNIYAVSSGTVTMAKFNGSGGCTVIVSNGNLNFVYCHVSPSFIVCVGQHVNKGDTIAHVGPKNVYGFPENVYRDSNGNPTNGATTGPHLHLSVVENGTAVDPLKYVKIPR